MKGEISTIYATARSYPVAYYVKHSLIIAAKMSSNSIYIKDMLEALKDGRVPGKWEASRTRFVFPTVVSTNTRGAKLFWTVAVRLLKGGKPHKVEDKYLTQPIEQLSALFKAEITVEAKQEDGKVRDHVPTYVTKGKNIGKTNATNVITQALRDALGKYNKQSHRADTISTTVESQVEAPKNDEAEAERVETESLAEIEAEEAGIPVPAKKEPPSVIDWRPPPMLVKKLGDSREATLTETDFKRGITLQPKLNGVRDISYRVENTPPSIFMYSRGKHAYLGMNHIRAELLPILAPGVVPAIAAGSFGVPERFVEVYRKTPVYLDGEIYVLGKPLQWISGQARKEADEKNLDYYVFDCFFPGPKAAGHDMESRHRQEYLDAIFAAASTAGLPHPHVVRVKNVKAHTEAEMFELAKKFVAEGYEGAIARKDWAGYRYSPNNYHSANLVKIKPRFDDEFTVMGFTQGTKGKDVGAVIWICEVAKDRRVDPSDYEFNVVPNMTYENRYKLFKCLSKKAGDEQTYFDKYVKGKPLTVQYAELSSKTGKPVQPKAVNFRTYSEGLTTGEDPIKKLFGLCGVTE